MIKNMQNIDHSSRNPEKAWH